MDYLQNSDILINFKREQYHLLLYNVNMMNKNSTINNNIGNNSRGVENNTSNDSSYLSDEFDVKDKNKNIKKYQIIILNTRLNY